ncbi:MAG TPA: nitroreductase family protein [Bacteroidales bacterium]|nr:nitroreductase family protein [Bacteroidales bacterium]
MAIPTSRTKEKAVIKIDKEKCSGCGLCVSVCKDFGLVVTDKKATLSENALFGCIACGHCMAVCPEDAIEIYGRELSPADLFKLPEKEAMAGYESLVHLLKSRRSIREFKDQPVGQELIARILDAASTAPMGLPPSDVNVLILDSKKKVRKFSEDYCAFLESIKWFVSGWFLAAMRPFWGKTNDELFRKFIRPLFEAYTGNMKKGLDFVMYDAPLAIYFYGSPYCDPADPLIAATYAMIAGESLGLGTCMLGGIHPMIQYSRKGKKFREAQGIRFPSREGLFVIFGYPAVKYSKGLHRTFASVTYKQ